MPAETAQKFASLEAQAQTLMAVFTKAGHEAVAPAVIQPADVFLDVIGESLRARTYVFTDPDGAELCLRPDLTVPTCRLHIARHADAATPAKYCYNGPAFRFQPQGADAAHPREFRQAGIERFGDTALEAAEAETVALILSALKAAGLQDWTLRIGDLGLFASVLDVANLPARWRKRLMEAFARPGAFKDEVAALQAGRRAGGSAVPAALLNALRASGTPAEAESILAEHLDAAGIELIGRRTLAEIAEHLVAQAQDAGAKPLDAAAAKLMTDYVAVSGPARTAGERVAALVRCANGSADTALNVYDRRLALLANAGIDLDRVSFSAEFGRNLGYYTGFVFEFTAPGLGAQSPVAGGGRYDDLMRAAGSAAKVPAVGGAIHTERLLVAVKGTGA